MIQINDNDLPIVVAEKIITATKPYKPTEVMKALAVVLTGDENAGETQDMFTYDEIAEIRDYLTAYLNNNED